MVRRSLRRCRSSWVSSSNPNVRPSKCSSSIMLNGRRLIKARGIRGSRGMRGSVTLSLLALLAGVALFAAGDQHGHVTFNGLPVPGATIVAIQRDKKIVAASDADGRYRLSGLADGPYTIRVEMLGFAPLTRDLVANDEATQPALELALLPFDEIKNIATI